MELVKKITGSGTLRVERYVQQDGHGAPRLGRGAPRLGVYQPPPPFIGTWEQMRHGGGKKKIHTVKPKFHKNTQ